jgi:Fe-S cluster assembly ATP-binding protein
MSLCVSHLQVAAGKTPIIKDVSFNISSGEIVALQGVNGSGKTTLARALAGDPGLKVVAKKVMLNNVDLLALTPEKRFAAGLFLSFQHPVELPHITVTSFLKAIYFAAPNASFERFADDLEKNLHLLKLPIKFLERIMNQDFSGGEKKRLELLQLLLLEPKFAILDELDSGVDKNTLELFAKIIKNLAKEAKVGFLVISHYQKFIDLLKPSRVITLKDGRSYEERP